MVRDIVNSDYKSYINLLNQLTEVGLVTEENFSQFLQTQNELNKTIVYQLDDTVVGCLTFFCEQKFHHSLGKVIHIEDVVTDMNHRGKGIGKILVDYVIGIAKEKGCYKIILNCSDENVLFYEKCGFTKNQNQMVIRFS